MEYREGAKIFYPNSLSLMEITDIVNFQFK